jgi:citrate lyase subunit beta / citryl-CoA lyase
MQHPADALFDPEERRAPTLPVCDHYAGIEARMRKALELQSQMGPVFDVTLDNEDGAPVGAEVAHAHLVRELLNSPQNRFGRVAVRVLSVDHPKFDDVLRSVVAGDRKPCHVMLPKPVSSHDVDRAARALDAAGAPDVPLHALIETHGGLRHVDAIAAHPRIQSLSFGLMDFVSAHQGAIPASAMGAQGQFEHPLVIRAKLEIAVACHAHGKVPSHCVVTEFKDTAALQAAAMRARNELGYTRMWSIHPAQIEPVVAAFAPTHDEVQTAIAIIDAAQAAHWAPIQHQGVLQDRASYRFHWRVLEQAHGTGGVPKGLMGDERLRRWFGSTSGNQAVT